MASVVRWRWSARQPDVVKTNLLIERARSTRPRVAWITLGSADNGHDHLYRYLISALPTLEPHLGKKPSTSFKSRKEAAR